MLLAEKPHAGIRLIVHWYILNFIDLGQNHLTAGPMQKNYYLKLSLNKLVLPHIASHDAYKRFVGEDEPRETSRLANQLIHTSCANVANQEDV